jgi:hypothetical protein
MGGHGGMGPNGMGSSLGGMNPPGMGGANAPGTSLGSDFNPIGRSMFDNNNMG